MTRQRWLELGVVAGIMILLLALLLPAVHRAREEARKSSSKNNLKQIGLALHNYHETHQSFPPGGTIRGDGVAMHGWMMMIMPYLDASPYYNMVDSSLPWSSPENFPVCELSKPVYQIPETDMGLTSDGQGVTFYLGNSNLLHRNSSIALRDLKGGVAHNWFAGEVAGNFQPWAYPFNWRTLGTKLCDGPNSFGYPAWDGAIILLADGKVSYFSKQTSPEVLKRMAELPPVATSEQVKAPDHKFNIGDYYWESINLDSNPEGINQYIVKVLRDPSGRPLSMNVCFKFINRPGDLPEYKGKGAAFQFLAHISPETDVDSLLKSTVLVEETTPQQLEANVKLLQSLQGRLPQIEPGHQGI
ncbi:DUF1559 domain-containing protein [Gimesia maris]|uniref:DUF1559 family PulG-like putative transporter n=1 Tax=Gimesia maris TaxID=122 RepID=UPI00241C0CD6|nr:DUF1559 domain-containing protein [Gimesia maris]|tara:strand:+ start:20693 stop:21766 length:1074 start_codon:yes stop_codon:yes gene_type:complete